MSVLDIRWLCAFALLGACDSADPREAGQGVAAASLGGAGAQPKPLLEGEATLKLLAQVNQPDVAKARPYAERHALIEKVAATDDGARIDQRLNLALDLRQAADAPDPCAVYGAALGRIRRSPDPYFADHLQAASPPSACDGLPAERDAVLATVASGTSPPRAPETVAEATPEPVPERSAAAQAAAPSRASGSRSRTPRGRKSRGSSGLKKPAASAPKPAAEAPPEPAPPSVAKPPKRGVASKIDEELKPFGM